MQTRATLFLFTLASALIMSACSDEGESTPDVTDDLSTDGGDDTTVDTTPDSTDTVESDIDEPDFAADDRQIGEACLAGQQCESGLCVSFGPGTDGFCSRRCQVADDCPSSRPGEEPDGSSPYDCSLLRLTSGGQALSCVDVDFCYDPDEDGYGVGFGCLPGGDCDQTRADVNPGAPERCDNIDHNCNGPLTDFVEFEDDTCVVPGQIGACGIGEPECVVDGDTVSIQCNQLFEPGDLAEVCNGIDDDCDGQSDEVDDDVQGVGFSCSTNNSACPDGIFECNAQQLEYDLECVSDGTSVGGSGTEESPICNGIDDD